MKRALMFPIRYELRLWEALFRWMFRRPHRVEPGTVAFSYTGGVALLFGVFIGLSALEIPILHLILPWPTARAISLIVGAYGIGGVAGTPKYEVPDAQSRSSGTIGAAVTRIRRCPSPGAGASRSPTAGGCPH